jgi:hypothetical protein
MIPLNDGKSDRFGSDSILEGQLKERCGRMDSTGGRHVPEKIDEGAQLNSSSVSRLLFARSVPKASLQIKNVKSKKNKGLAKKLRM